MFKLKLTDNRLRWLLVIGLMVLPLIFIHSASHEAIPRLISTLLLFTIFPGVFLFLALNPNEKPISLAPRLRGRYPEKILKKWDIIVKIFVGIFMVLAVYYMTIPLLVGTYKLTIEKEPFGVIEGSVMNQQSTLFGFVFLIWTFDLQDNGEHYQFWYPNMIRSTGERYQFTVLPGTNFVVDSERVE